jgi:hypothetical protein
MTITALSKADHAQQDHPRWRERMQSVGFPRTDVEVRVVDDADRALIPRIVATGLRVGATDSIMTDDVKAEALARFALGLLG